MATPKEKKKKATPPKPKSAKPKVGAPREKVKKPVSQVKKTPVGVSKKGSVPRLRVRYRETVRPALMKQFA